MKDTLEVKNTRSKKQIWMERIWGTIPIVLICVIIVGLLSAIQSKSNLLKAKKEGIHTLEGKEVAIDNIDQVLPLLQTATDPNQAIKDLQTTLKLSKSQAQAIVQMPLSELTVSKKGELKNSIAQIKVAMASNEESSGQIDPRINVVAMKLIPQSIHDQLSFPGIVEPWLRLDVRAEVSGKVIAKKIEEGDIVEKGDIIAQIDPEKYRNNYLSSKARYQFALSNLKRRQELHKEELATRSQLDNAIAEMENYKAAMNNAEKDLNNCTIRSPIDGYANTVAVEKGQYITQGAEVAVIIQIDSVKVKVGIPESDVDAVRKLNTFDVKIDALGGEMFTGQKHFFSRSADSNARLYNLEIAVSNSDFQILPDMFTRVEIIKNERDNSIVIPIYSLVPYNSGHVVYIAEGNKAIRRKVKTGIQEGWVIEVTEGLAANENLIVVGHRRVSDGQKINITRTITDPKELLR